MKVQIQALTIALSQQELLKAINPKTLEKIKAKNPHPYFQAYTIVHEGTSTPNVINEVNKPIEWLKQVVLSAGSAIRKGVQFFAGHVKDNNSTKGRKPLGRVVGKLTKEINGKVNQIVVGYFPDKDAVSSYDVCSIEADVEVKQGRMKDFAKRLLDISGIALASSSVEKPAFPGATVMASLQCFAGEAGQQTVDNGQGDKNMTYQEFLNALSANFGWLKQVVVDKKIYPSQLGYSEQDLRQDFEFKEMFNKIDTTAKDLEDTKKLLEDEKTARAQDQKSSLAATAKDRIKQFIPEGFTEKQKTWLMNVFDPSELADLSDEGLKKFVEESPEKYKKQALAFGIKEESLNLDQGSGQQSLENDEQFNRFKVENDNEDAVAESLLDDILDKKPEEE